MGSQTNSFEENIPRGCLKLNNRIYPVYEGLNTVGRNPEAVINIKNLNISQQHAIITIVDANSHFISDFKSSNGTAVDNKKLKPLKLYKLLNGASVKFADVFCTYKKLDSNEQIMPDSLEETQNFNETLYEANTQAIHLHNSDKSIINEMPTQVITPSINELPTQVFNYDDSVIGKVVDDAHDSSSNDSLDFITMQKATQSQGFALNQSDSDTEEQSAIAPVKLNTNKNTITSDSEGVQSTPEILPVKLNSSKSISSSDSEGTQSASDIKKNLTDPEQEEESCSQICPVRTSIKNPIESDSDSDTEEYIPRPERRKSRYVISDDDETDIEDADKAENTMNDTDIIPNTQEKPQKPESSSLEQSSMDSFRLELSERRNESTEEMEEKDMSSIAQDHIYCQDASKEPNTSSNKNNESLSAPDIQKQNSQAEDHVYCQSLASRENLILVNKDKDSTKQNNNSQDVENSVEEAKKVENGGAGDGERPPQTAELASDDQNPEKVKKSHEKEAGEDLQLQNSKETGQEVDIFDQPTQQLDLNFADDDTLSVVGSKEFDRDSELTEELTIPTDQKLEVKNDDEATVRNDEKNLQSMKDLAVDIFEELAEQAGGDDETQSVVGDKEVDRNSDTEELILTDQKSEQQKDEKKSESRSDLTNHDNLDQTTESKNEDDDIFAQATQQIDLNFVGDRDKADDEIYLQSTQKLSTSERTPNKDRVEDGDIYVQPTQQINEDVGHTSKSAKSRESDDFYLLPTQQLKNSDKDPCLGNDSGTEDEHKDENSSSNVKDHEFTVPFLPVASEKKTALEKNEDDDDFFSPTQALESLHKEDQETTTKPTDASDYNLNTKEVEDQLEMLFYSQSDHRFVATQQLVDVLEDKDNDEDIIEASMIEESDSSLKSKIPKFSTDSIRLILDEDLEVDEKNKELEDKVHQTETKADDNDLESDDSQNRKTRKRRESPEENSSERDEKKDDKKSRRIRKEEIEELQEQTLEKDDGKKSKADSDGRTTRTQKRSKKDNGKETYSSEDVSGGKMEEKSMVQAGINKDNRTREEKQEKLEDQTQVGKGRTTRTKTRSNKNDDKETDLLEDISNNKVKAPSSLEEKNENQTDNIKKDKRTRKEKTEELTDQTQEKHDGKQSATRNKDRTTKIKTRSKKNDDKETDFFEDTSCGKAETPAGLREKDVNQTDDVIKGKRTRKDTEKASESGDKGRVTRKGTRGKKDGQEEEKSNDEAESLVHTKKENATDLKENNVEQPNKKESKTVSKGRPTRKTTRSMKDDDKSSEISEDGSSREVEKMEDVKRDERTTKEKTVEVNEDEINKKKEPETDDKIRPIRSSKRVRKDNDKDSESSDVTEEKESNRKNRGKRKNIESHEESNRADQSPVETEIHQASGSVTRKRNLKATNLDSGDEFETKVQKVETPKKTPAAKQKSKNVETMVRPETPTPRKSARTRKLKLDEDEALTSSSVTNEVASVSTSSVSEEPAKKSRRLSANSRAQRNEEEKNKQKEVRSSSRKASVQGSPPAVLATPERSRRQLKPKVVFTMMDNPELESLIRQLGGSVVDTVDACTVLVTVSVKRSQKLLCAVGQGKPICSPEWLHACKKAYSFLDPWDYILVDAEAEKKWDFSLRESLNRSTKTKLLENYTFQLIVNTAADVLKGAIEACGGKCVSRNLPKADTTNKIIVSSSENKNKYIKILKQDPTIKVVEAEAIFDGALRQECRFDKYLLK